MDAKHALTAAELAQRLGLELRGDPAIALHGVGSLAAAGPGELAFLSSARYRGELAATRAGAVLLRGEDAAGYPGTALVAGDPYAAYARAAALFHPRRVAAPGIHPSAVVHADAEVDPAAEVGPLTSIGARSRVAAGAIVGPGCVIGEDCAVGRDCELVARVTLVARVLLGARVRIHPGAVLGADGFGLAMDAGRWINVPQLGGVRVGDDCEIGANTTIDRGAIEDTVLEEDVRLDNLIQIAHNVHVGAHTAMAGCVGIAGSARIGRYCMLAGAAGVAGHLEICDHVVVTAMSMVSQSIREPGEYSSGISVMRSRDWRRSAARLRQLDGLARRVIALERERE
ncbi:UDP-3-O-(3-hydroxymyristoyl)glucosamine N-acyltransferase [Luteimonas sp. RD2P54]|uniref:UDP-3-O-acylglucosamine N-acyltransferase n=1 Tax=Luteimonas endophytica TaxID=3042023 RepID=A0ABT6J9A3_9GAMM|nr:UDP-3-O-(3-hydroxymyristoyl)glucosamine N-acyltransferase [Luteimonas endophytica]MDH5823401.1 UDP-3-O-(3-hydroxymyristoyl)glucosamine N-acyltransferase [Luteimonas endophytica]